MDYEPVHYCVIKAYESPYPDPIVLHEVDVVALGKEFTDDPDWQGWVWCEGTNGVKAWVPKPYLEQRGEIATLKRDYNAMELSVAIGEVLLVDEIVNGFGMAQKPDGTRGWVPMKHLARVQSEG